MGFAICLGIVVAVIFNAFVASMLEDAAQRKGYGKEVHAFAICFWLGIFGCLYVIALPDLKQQKKLNKIVELLSNQTSESIQHGDVAWEFEELSAEAPKRDGSADAFLREIGKTPEEYICNSLAIVSADEHGECSVCHQKQKTTKHCRLKQNNVFRHIPICTDCINAFIEYNPKSVYDLETKE